MEKNNNISELNRREMLKNIALMTGDFFIGGFGGAFRR
jgi:hypothetical protein